MKRLVIANPHARNGRGRKKLGELDAHLHRLRLAYELSLCESLDHACWLSREANRSGYDVIVAVGGDGTINRVLNGFYDSSGRRISQARMGVVHIGTSPDFCRSYRVPTEVIPAAQALAAGITRPITVGKVTCKSGLPNTAANGDSSFYFGCCANIGLGASLARLANGGIRKYAGDFLGTFLSLLRVLHCYRPRTLHVTLDGETRVLDRVYNISVGKSFYIASGLKVRHSLKDHDKRLYVLCLRNLSWHRLGGVLRSLYSGKPIASGPCLSLDYARRISLASAESETEVEFDGDPAGRCPCQIETAPDPLDLIVEATA